MKQNLYEVKFGEITAMVYARDEKGVRKAFAEWFNPFFVSVDSMGLTEISEHYLEITHMGSNPKDWNLDSEPYLVSAKYESETNQ